MDLPFQQSRTFHYITFWATCAPKYPKNKEREKVAIIVVLCSVKGFGSGEYVLFFLSCLWIIRHESPSFYCFYRFRRSSRLDGDLMTCTIWKTKWKKKTRKEEEKNTQKNTFPNSLVEYSAINRWIKPFWNRWRE